MENTLIEIWKDIPGYEGLYHASNTGKIKSLANTKFWGGKPNEEKVLVSCANTRGYLCVNLYKNGQRKTIRVHKLVAEAFLPNPENKCCVNHKDGNRLDNRLENLEWCTWSENTAHAHRTGLASNKNATLAAQRKVIDTKNGRVYSSIREASKEIGISYHSFHRMIAGQAKNKTSLMYL